MKPRKDGDFHGRTVSLPEGMTFFLRISGPQQVSTSQSCDSDGRVDLSWNLEVENLENGGPSKPGR